MCHRQVFLIIFLSLACQPERQPPQQVLADSAIQITTLTDSVGSRQLSESFLARARKYKSMNQNDSAIHYFKKAEVLFENYFPEPGTLLDYYSGIGQVYFKNSEYVAADRPAGIRASR